MSRKSHAKLVDYEISDFEDENSYFGQTPTAHSTPNLRISQRNTKLRESENKVTPLQPYGYNYLPRDPKGRFVRSTRNTAEFTPPSILNHPKKPLNHSKNVVFTKISTGTSPMPIPMQKLRRKTVSVQYKEPSTLRTPEIEARLKLSKKIRNKSDIHPHNAAAITKNLPGTMSMNAVQNQRKSSVFNTPYHYQSEKIDRSKTSRLNEGENRPTCRVCFRQFSSLRHVGIHHNTVHVKVPVRLQCPYCVNLYALSYLDRHMKECFLQNEEQPESMAWSDTFNFN